MKWDELMSEFNPIPAEKIGLQKTIKNGYVRGVQVIQAWVQETWKSSLLGILFFYLVLSVVLGSLIESGLPKAIDILLFLVASSLLVLLVSFLLLLAGKLLRFFPKIYLVLIGAIISSLTIYSMVQHIVILIYGIPLLIIGAITGMTIGFIIKGDWLRVKTILHLTLACSLTSVFAYWILYPGSEAAWSTEEWNWSEQARTDLINPGIKGTYEIEELSYGSGTDQRRVEFGTEVDLITESVDVTPFIRYKGKIDRFYREWFWGFSLDQAPLNGRVWKPKGDGKFPLVLLVHGNHNMVDYSDDGYAYLGELLASKGYIAVSVDQNYLNSSLVGGIIQDNAARAWLMLEHLQLWREWNETENHPFYENVNMEKIALIGHSRGGEAVATATLLNQLSHYPDNANIRFDYNFDIESVVAIAPVDGQYRPTDKAVDLENVNYFVLHGSNDIDVREFLGIRQYNRINLTEGDYFKSSLYIFGANHGQFNTSWEEDVSAPLSWMINRKAILDPEEQRQIAKVYISSFLDATLKEKQEYRSLFQNNRYFESWLPNTLYSTQYEDSSFTLIADYSEDMDVTTATIPDVSIEGKYLSMWKERNLFLRHGSWQDNQAVYLGWRNNHATYSISFPASFSTEQDTRNQSKLVLNLAEVNVIPLKRKPDVDENEETLESEAEIDESISFSIELVDRNGNIGRIMLDNYAAVRPVYHVRYTKFKLLEMRDYSSFEHVLQTYEIPLTDFIEDNPLLDPSQLSQIIFRFDQSNEGTILIDKIGFSRN